MTFLKQQPIQDATQQYEAVEKKDLADNQIVWLEPTPFNNTYAFAVKEERAQELGLNTLSDMAAYLRSGRRVPEPGRRSAGPAADLRFPGAGGPGEGAADRRHLSGHRRPAGMPVR